MKDDIKSALEAEREKEQGNAFFSQGDYELAIFHYTRSINYRPKCSILYTNRSLAYFKIGSFQESLEDALKAKELDRDNLKSYYRICEAYSALKDEENYRKYERLYREKRSSQGAQTKRGEETTARKGTDGDFPTSGSPLGKGTTQGMTQQRSIKQSDELMHLGETDHTNRFVFMNQPEINDGMSNFAFEKKSYRNNFLIEEVYDFDVNRRGKGPTNGAPHGGAYGGAPKRKEGNSSHSAARADGDSQKKPPVSQADLLDDVELFLNNLADICMHPLPFISVPIERETKKGKAGSYHNANVKTLKGKADELFAERKFEAALELYNEVIREHDSERGIYYCTALSNRSACHVEMKKIRSALCDVSNTLSILFSFFQAHREDIKRASSAASPSSGAHEEAAAFLPTDLELYKDPKGIYSQAHKLVIKLLFRYVKHSHQYRKNGFRVPSLLQVDTLRRMKGIGYVNAEELERVRNAVYAQL
ncbi:tetratricopeptide repeat protein, putative [Plasmodium vivax]|uniref:Tetratricopeptide repeat protein, putative n=1 Tax=Plasmodium vivax TaxID=5855 RepID=A0A564ZPV2_PLAVI|nr:tetratricopeptide repeat protein, putative [Plasmodium vivax]